MENGDFDLAGFVMGAGQPVFVSNFQVGTMAERVQDVDSPFTSTRVFGRDQRTPPVWSFEFSVSNPAGTVPDAGVLAALESLTAAWQGAADTETPGTVAWLRYKVAGRVRGVYGRPRNLSFDPSVNLEDGNIVGSAQFALQDTLTYSDELNSSEVRLRATPTGYVTLPAVWPLISTIESTRQGQFQVGGTAAGPVEDITFYGPVANPRLVNANWAVQLDTEIPYDGWVRINPRNRTVLNQSGASLAGALSRRTYLPSLLLPPGAQDLTYSGVDLTATSRAVVRWRDSYRSL